MSEDVAVPDKGGEVALKDDQALAAAALAGIDSKDLQLPIIKIGQQLTNEVVEKAAESGDFINSLTGDVYGNDMEFVVVHYFKGRLFAPDGEEQVYVASGDVAPDSWPEQYAGQPFVDIPDAEEQHRIQANEEDGEWGHGPLIQTTHNYIGFVPSEPGVPARVTLKGTSTPAAKKINTLLSFSRRAPWASTIRLQTVSREKNGKKFFVVRATQGTATEDDTIEAAKDLAQQVQSAGAFRLTGDEPDAVESTGKPVPTGGVAV